ncbi:cytochrome P450 [Mangrovimicrobium sediminis]|uniref:Cytochrome P450 n=1 Tax=Mangrovimicrobium sediminis TaxID=2562682 RepID=A0A4Z0M176_9GAMM|nr:cytochrome P450 [Haliea sp. SAOS-164]TGD73291.1 cytochrome P450 [Haliea sp. SAOS-164]
MAIDATRPVPPEFPRIAGSDNIPDHVDPALVRTTGIPFSPEFLVNPHGFMADLHERMPPVYYEVNNYGNAWQLIKHADALFMLRHPEIFTNEGATPFPRDPDDYFYFIPIEIDPPHHKKYRAILDPVFSPKAVLTLQDKIRTLANELIDEFQDKGECEFTTAFGRPLPVMVFLDLMGLPQEKRDTFVDWAMDLLHSQDPAVMGRAMQSISSYLKEVIAEKVEHPDDRVISRIAHAEVDGRPMTPPEIFGFVVFLFIGGLDTVFATLNNIWLWLANNPERVRELIDEPENIDNQVEELLRMWTVTFSGRMLSQDYEFHGVKMKKGDRISAILPTCNFDPDVFPNPKETDFHRRRKPVLAFAGGVHSCMGAHLARLEIKIALQEWLRRIPEFSVKPGTTIEYRPGGVVGPEHVPLVW